MRLNGYRCDGCGKEYLSHSNGSHVLIDLPATWFLVFHPNGVGQEFQFCSQQCVSKYFLEQAKKEQPS